jgi:hypothetical protein
MRRPCSSWPTCPAARPRTRPPPTGDTYLHLVTGFGISTATAYRYLREALELPAAMAPSLQQAIEVARGKAYVIFDIFDGTFAADRPGRQELRSGPALYAAGSSAVGERAGHRRPGPDG